MLNTNAYAKVLYTNPIKMMVDLGGGGGLERKSGGCIKMAMRSRPGA